jgi:hypothetical protein
VELIQQQKSAMVLMMIVMVLLMKVMYVAITTAQMEFRIAAKQEWIAKEAALLVMERMETHVMDLKKAGDAFTIPLYVVDLSLKYAGVVDG